MATMDLSINQELMGVQKTYDAEYGNHAFELQETFQETDITRNNNFFNPLKTETGDNHACDPNPLYQVNCKNSNEFEVDNSLFSYSSFKKAMDLRIHNRTVDGVKRTIFDDAEYFARNCCYKLLPITFEQVDETIIHTEHNYSLFSRGSDSESEEDCSRTMDYSLIREKNYKKRRTKILESSDQEEVDVDEKCKGDSISLPYHPGDGFRPEPSIRRPDELGSFAGQPLDLSAPPAVQHDKTEALSSIPEEAVQPDSDKENAGGELGGIRVTITRPDEKESYQPCDLFLNDIARLVPWLIDKDCFEVDILDRTCDRLEDVRKHRLYYVIAESTWRSFQNTNERVILTNDRSLGQPLKKAEREEKPSYLVFDQFSLAKCLAEYCQEIGGCFEYTCVEEGRESAPETAKEGKSAIDEWSSAKPKEKKEETEAMEESEENKEPIVEARINASEDGVKEFKNIGEKKKVEEQQEESAVDKSEALKKSDLSAKAPAPAEKIKVALPRVKNQARKRANSNKEANRDSIVLEKLEKRKQILSAEEAAKKKDAEGKKREKKASESKPKRKPPALNQTQTQMPMRTKTQTQKPTQVQAQTQKETQKQNETESKNCRITTRSKSSSEFETSQTSDKRVSKKEGRKRRETTPPTQQPPNKRKRTPIPEEVTVRSRRSATVPAEVEITPTPKKKPEKTEMEEKKDDKREKRQQSAETRSLRSRTKTQKKEKDHPKGKGRAAPSRKAGRR